MKLLNNIIQIWKNKWKILQGLFNRIFKTKNVEAIAAARMKICKGCVDIDHKGDKCMVPGTAPCCKVCGCSLETATRSLAYECPKQYWRAVMTQAEEDAMNDKLGI